MTPQVSKNRLLYLLIGLLAATTLWAAACGGVQGGSQQSADSQSGQSSGKTPGGQGGQESRPVTLELLGGPMGSTNYVTTFSLAEVINNNSATLKAAALETTGATENARTLVERPEKRSNSIADSNLFTLHQAKAGDSPFTKPYDGLRLIAGNLKTITTFATLNPNLKTKDDLVGKKISIGQKGIATWWKNYFLLKNGWGIWDEKNIENLDFTAGKDALLDGLIDVSVQAASEGEAGSWPPIPATMELINTKTTYFIAIDKESLAKAEKETGYPLPYVELPAGSLGPTQVDPLGTIGYYMAFAADQSLSEDIAYQVTKVMYENIGKFGEYHVSGKSLTPASMYRLPGTTRDDFHPGALKFYDEMGLKVGESQ